MIKCHEFVLISGYSIEYNKKPGKPATVKVVKEPNNPREDLYKSGVIHTGPGEPPESVSRPTPRGKEGIRKPISSGKLLKPGGPGGRPSRLGPSAGRTNMAPAPSNARGPSPSRPVSQTSSQSIPQAPPRPNASQASRIVPQPVVQQPIVNSTPTITTTPAPPSAAKTVVAGSIHSRENSSSSIRAPPPPPPPSAPAPVVNKEPTYRALYDFAGQSSNELNLKKDDIVIIVQKENNGRTPVLKSTDEPVDWTH